LTYELILAVKIAFFPLSATSTNSWTCVYYAPGINFGFISSSLCYACKIM